MSKQERVLAELMGWKFEERQVDPDCKVKGWWSPSGSCGYIPDYDTDRNAMHEVHKVLWERRLWDEFEKAYCDKVRPRHANDWIYRFLNDLPGQVQAAIKVLKEAK